MKALSEEYRRRLFEAINAAAFAAHLELRIVELEHGSSTMVMGPAPFRMQPFGVMHGGNIATLIDSATFWACFVAIGHDHDALTSVDLKVNYLAPAREEGLLCTGRMIKAGRTLSYAEAEVRAAGDRRLIAHGSSILMRIPGAGPRLGVPMFRE